MAAVVRSYQSFDETLPDLRTREAKVVQRSARVVAAVATVFAIFPSLRWGASLVMRSVACLTGAWSARRAKLSNNEFNGVIQIAMVVPAALGLAGFLAGKMAWMVGALIADVGLRLMKTTHHFIEREWRQGGESLAVAAISAVAAMALATLSLELMLVSMLATFGFFLYRSVMNEYRGDYLALSCDALQLMGTSWIAIDMAATDYGGCYSYRVGDRVYEAYRPPICEFWPKKDFISAPIVSDTTQQIFDIPEETK